MFLQLWRNQSRAVAVLKVVGTVGQTDDSIADGGLRAFRHVARKDVCHAFGEAYLLVVAIHGAARCRHTLEVRIDTSVGAVAVRHMLSYLPSQTLLAQRALFCIANRVAFMGFLNQ